MKRALMTTAALAIGLGIAVPVFAQQQTGPGAGQGQTQSQGFGPGHHFARMCEDQDAHLAGMLAFAEKKLNITDAQRAAWTKFADAARASEKPVQDLCAKYKGQPLPTALPQRLERADAMMSAHLQQLQQVRPALNDLYAQLSPDQQKTADGLLGRPGMGGPGMGMMGGHHFGGHGGHRHFGSGESGQGSRGN